VALPLKVELDAGKTDADQTTFHPDNHGAVFGGIGRTVVGK
jgi:hypothetical protein